MCYARSRLLVTYCSRVIRVIMARRQLNLLNCWGHNVVSRGDAEGQSQAMDSAESATTEEPPPKRRAAARVHLSTVIGWQATSFPWIELEEEGGVVAKVFCKYCRQKPDLVRATSKAVGTSDVTSFCRGTTHLRIVLL